LRVRVRQSTIIDAPCAEVWRILRDFNGHDRWHPAVATSAIEGGEPTDAVGSVRRFKLADGSELREQLLSLSDKDFRLTYCILEAPLPLMGYVAAIQLKPVTDGDRTFWEWRSEFEPPDSRRDELVTLVTRDIYQAGFGAIRSLYSRPSPRPAVAAPSLARPLVTAERLTPRMSSGAAERTKAILVDRYGGPEVLRLAEIELPPPAPSEVQIRHTAIGVNYIDVYCRTGYFDLLKPPGVPGMEAAGVIDAVGADVRGFSVGERVAYACPPVGAYCERRNMSPELLVRLSNDTPDDIAAAALLKGVTASFLLHDIHPIRPGEFVLVHAGAGGVGQILVQWARQLGATVIAVVSNDEKRRALERLGAPHVVVSSRERFVDVVMGVTNGRGVDVVYDAVGAATFDDSLESLAIRGHLISFGQASGDIGERHIGRLSGKSVTLSRPNYGHYTDTADKLEAHVRRFFAALRQGVVSVRPPRIFDLARVSDAHRALESRQTIGALVLRP
jgi:NADPH:quinone reductase